MFFFNGFLFSQLAAWDQQISDVIVSNRTPVGNAVFYFITKFGDWYGMLILLVLMALLLWKKQKNPKRVLWPFGSVCVSWVILFIIKNLVQRSRPLIGHLAAASGYSFPSMHSALSVLFYGWAAYLLLSQGIISEKRKKWVWAGAGLMALLIGSSRMYLNVHFCTDVLAGWSFGGLFLWLSLRAYQAWGHKKE